MLLIVFGRAFQIFLTLATTKLVTSLLSSHEVGRVALVQSLALLFSLVFINPVQMFVARRLHGWHDRAALRAFLALFSGYVVATTAVGLLLLGSFDLVLGIGLPFSLSWLLVLVGGTTISLALNQAYVPTLNFLERRGPYVLLNNGTLLCALLLSVLLTKTNGMTAEWWLLGAALAQILGWFMGVFILARYSSAGVKAQDVFRFLNHRQMKTLAVFGVPIAVSVGLVWVQTQSYRFIVEDALGLETLGRFVAGYSVASGVISAFESVLLLYLQPGLYREFGSEDAAIHARAWNRFFSVVVPSLLITGAFVMAVGPELTRIVLGPAFHDVYVFLIWGVLAEAARVLGGAYGFIAHAKMNTKLLVPGHLVGALVAGALAITLIPQGGVQAAGLALALGGAAAVMTLHLVLRRKMKIEWPVRRFGFAIVGSLGLWGLAFGLRLATATLSPTIGALVLLAGAGLALLGLQFSILRLYLRTGGEK